MKTSSVFIAISFLFLAYLPGHAQRTTADAAGATSRGYLKFDGIDGESVDKDHKGWCNLTSFSQSFTRPETTSTARRRGAVTVGDIVCVKELDKSSPKLQEAICTGKVFPKVEFELANSSGIYLKYELKNVMISSYSVSGESGRPIEQFSINFEEIKVTYTEQVADKSSGKVEYSWKVEEGVK